MGSFLQQPTATPLQQNYSANSLINQLAMIANGQQIPKFPQNTGYSPVLSGADMSGGIDFGMFTPSVANQNAGRRYNFEGGIGMKDPIPMSGGKPTQKPSAPYGYDRSYNPNTGVSYTPTVLKGPHGGYGWTIDPVTHAKVYVPRK